MHILTYIHDYLRFVFLSQYLCFAADGPNFKIQKIIDGGLCPRMVEFLMAEDKSLVAPALRAVGNILTGDDVQTQVNCLTGQLGGGSRSHFMFMR